jgi:hypothetical protein
MRKKNRQIFFYNFICIFLTAIVFSTSCNMELDQDESVKYFIIKGDTLSKTIAISDSVYETTTFQFDNGKKVVY